ncbi:MAG TPA: peptidoglycan-binding protein LysM [Actinomycetota bacterium]|jgi:Tfp pilus assembly protein FimV|nr:peptidoglycan-binding protein LysM [Actinomycetota bacterium]
MAVRREELEGGRGGRIYRFPVAAVRRNARRERMLARRRRAGVAATLSAVVVMSLLGGGTSVASRPGAPRAVTLEAGETLWEVAGRYAPEGIDRRAYVHALIELNGLAGMPRAGQRIRLPR